MKHIEIKAFAKVNLGLRILGERRDGYHNIESVFQTVSVHDELEIEKAKNGLSISSNDPGLPCDERNLCYRAVEVFREHTGLKDGLAIHISKEIPIGAGLGGGSSDAASVLVALNVLFGLNVSNEKLKNMALSVGSDVPFFIIGGTALVTGRGENIKHLDPEPFFRYIIVFPGFGIDTKWAYNQINFLTKRENCSNFFIHNFSDAGMEDLNRMLQNDFEEVMLKEYSELKHIKKLIVQNGACATSLSGSGSSIYGIFHDSEEADSALIKLSREGYWVRESCSVTSSKIPQFSVKG